MRDVATATSTGLGELSFIGLIQAFKTCNSRHAHVEALSPMGAIHGWSMDWSMEACCNPSVSSGSVRECGGGGEQPPNPAAFAEHKGGDFHPCENQ